MDNFSEEKENLINEFEEQLINIQKNINQQNDEFKNKKKEYDTDKKQFEKEKEKWYQLKSKLEADKRVYFIIKEQLESGELTENSMPVLFQDKYPIFKYMDDNQLIFNNDLLSNTEINNYLNALPLVAPSMYKDISVMFDINKSSGESFNDLFSSDPLHMLDKTSESSNNYYKIE